MPTYRAYQIGPAGHIVHAPQEFEAADDVAAIAQAGRYVDGCDIELWRGKRLVKKLPRGSHPAAKIEKRDEL